MLPVYAAALATIAASAVTGHAVRLVCEFPRSSWLAPAVGFATLLTVAGAATELGGGTTTGLALLGALLAAALALAAVRHAPPPPARETAPVAALVLLLLATPFLASGRVGVLGMGNSNDMVDHLTSAYWLQTGEGIFPRAIFYGYPLGPQSLAATLGELGFSLPAAFTGIMFAAPVLAAIAALAVLPPVNPLLRTWAAVLVGVPYLVVSYLGQGEFAEVIVALLVLAFVLTLRELMGEQNRPPRAAGVPVGLLVAGMVSTYSYLGFVWPVVLVGLLFALHLARSRFRPDAVRRLVATAAPIAAVAVVVLAAGIGAQASRIATFVDAPYANRPQDLMGNLIDPISPLTALGVWPATDVRVRPDHEVVATIGGAIALLALALALLWWGRRRDLTVLAAAAACALVYVQATLVKNPYASAKALPIAAPLVALVLAVPWLEARRARRGGGVAATGSGRAIVAVGAVIALGATASTALALRDTYVGTNAHGEALESLRPLVSGSPTLFLGYDDFVHWNLRGAELTTMGRLYARSIAPRRPEKAWIRGHAFDFDSVTAETLDTVRYVVAPRSPYASSAPENFALRRQNRWYRVWERMGPTPTRLVSPGEVGAPGAVLDCARDARTALPTDGVAAVLPTPIVGPAARWEGDVERRGGAATQTLALPAGRWDISLQYASRRALAVELLGLRVTMPANLGRVGPYWLVGTVDVPEATDARVTATAVHGRAARLLGAHAPTRAYSSPGMRPLGEVVATPNPWRAQLVPLEAACARYVDWYRSGAP